MNIFISGIIIFIVIFLLLSWFARTNTRKIAKNLRKLIVILALMLAVLLAVGGRILFSLPLFFLVLSALKIKGLTAFQIWQMWRVLNFLRSTGRFSYFGKQNQTQPSSNLSTDEAYKILGIKKGCSKQDVIKAAIKLQKKIHPDVDPNANTERLSQIVNEAKETIIKDLS